MLVTALLINKLFRRMFPAHISKLSKRFNSLKVTNNLETDLQVQLQMTVLLALLGQTGLLTLNVLRSWLTLLLVQTLCLVTLLEQTGLLTFDALRSLPTLLALENYAQ